MPNIFDYVQTEIANYRTVHVPVSDGYLFNMYEHIRMSTLFRDSKFTQGNNDYTRPFRNICRRIRNLGIVAMDFDVKDIVPFADESKNYYKSFLVKKFHPEWARKNNIDTYIDDMIESYEDYGLALSKHAGGVAPEVVPLQSIAFCDQTDILSGPICIKHQYSPAQLKEFEGKWGTKAVGADATIDELIVLSKSEKTYPVGNQSSSTSTASHTIQTPGKFIDVYELDGMFPSQLIKNNNEDVEEEDDTTKYSQQMHIVSFYKDETGAKKGLTLYKGKGDPKKYKALVRDKIFGRACGMGGIEELFHSQIWANYDEIRIQDMLDAASKIIHITTDATLATRNKISDMENNEFIVEKDGGQTRQLNTQPVNMMAFENASKRWEEHAQGIGSAYDAQLGEAPTAGTPFRLQNLVTSQGNGIHKKRRGQVATHLGEVYRDWILNDLVKEMNNEQEFSGELDLDEMEYVSDSVITNEVNNRVKQSVLAGQLPTPEEVDALKQIMRDTFMKGNKKFFKLIQGELKGIPMDVEVDIAGKQKDLQQVADTASNLFRQIFANPQGFQATMQIPGAAASFNDLLEASGLSPWKFEQMKPMAPVVPATGPGQPVPSPIQQPQTQPQLQN